MIVKKLNEMAVNVEKHNNKVLFEFDGRIFVSCTKFSGYFIAIVLDEDKLVCFDGISCFARVIPQSEWDSVKFE